MHPMQAGDVQETYADITAISNDLGYAPTTKIDVGVPKFVEWYQSYHNI
jgi:UDP-glucuronate 4-epimerase